MLSAAGRGGLLYSSNGRAVGGLHGRRSVVSADPVVGIVTFHLLEDFHVADLVGARLHLAALMPSRGHTKVLLDDGEALADWEDLADLVELALVVMLVCSGR